ncbi:MAG: acyltransferase family protein, partial [Flavisolibacter sp.]
MQTNNRYAYIDWLRIIAIMGVLFFHSAMPYVAEWEWHIKNKETSNLLLEFNFFLSRFRMPLLFFISGVVTHVMLQKRSSGQFIVLRFRRLFIPLLFGVLLIVPLQVYMERVSQGFKGNFFEFYPSIFSTGAYPEGNFSWHHLWFIAYLFVYDILLAPLFKWIITKRPAEKFFQKISQGKMIYLVMIPSVIAFSATVMIFPETHDLINDWCWNFYWLFFLLAGFLCMHLPAMMESLERNRQVSLTLGISTILMINYLRWNQVEPSDIFADYKNQWQTYLYIALYAITA